MIHVGLLHLEANVSLYTDPHNITIMYILAMVNYQLDPHCMYSEWNNFAGLLFAWFPVSDILVGSLGFFKIPSFIVCFINYASVLY